VLDVSNSVVNTNHITNNFFLNFFLPSNKSYVFHSIIFLFIYIFLKNILLILFQVYKNYFLIKAQEKISLKMLDLFFNQQYIFFIRKNSSELISIMLQDINMFMRGYAAVLHLLIETCLLIFILFYLFFLNIEVGLVFIIAMVFYFFIYLLFTKKKLLFLGSQRNILFQEIIKDLNESFGNFRELIIYNCKKFFFDQISRKYRKFFLNLRQDSNLQQNSKILIEQVFIIAIILIFSFLIYTQNESQIKLFIPLLTVYLFAFLKILPSFNRIVVETQSYVSNKLFINKINNQFNSYEENKIIYNEIISFKDTIQLKNISFRFSDSTNDTFYKLNLNINKNDIIGIIGKSGSGKTTFLNLLMGFLHPTDGEILVDGMNINKNLYEWRKKIAYVSQSIYLLDESILKNITFHENINDVDANLLEKSILLSGLEKFVKNLPLGIHTKIGERGSKISGGEILRVALARAFYSNKEIFILDEFTSALDAETEMEILNSLEIYKKTIIMVSHKKSALKKCNKIYQLNNSEFLTS
jgi:ABC-type multidrug transport system fused ATPase/permease subunit